MADEKTAKALKHLDALKLNVATVQALILQLRSATQPAARSTSSIQPKTAKSSSENVLHLAYDAASLIKAHSTKVSLMIINKPFTPTAISTIIREMAAGPLPALAAAVEQCAPETYTTIMAKEMHWRVDKVLVETASLIKEIPLTGEILSDDEKHGRGSGPEKGSLASTGVLWKACDDLMALKTLGVAGLVIKKAEQYRDTLKDALEELQEWGEEEDEDEDDELADALDNAHMDDVDPAQQAVDDIFGSQRHIPKDDTHKIRERLDSSVKRLRMVTLMYQAIVKRRFKLLPPIPVAQPITGSAQNAKLVQTLDEILSVLKKIPDITDELANGFYELDVKEIDKRMDDVFFTAYATAELLLKDWNDQQDEFSEWLQKFQASMKKGW